MTAPFSFFPEHPGTVAYDFGIYRAADDAEPGMKLQQRRYGCVDRLHLPAPDAVELIGALLESIADAHLSFFEQDMRDMFQRIVDELHRQKRSGAA
jgi:hypothetical protein